MRFEKWEALGNTYLLVEQPDAGPLTSGRVVRLCDDDAGLGSDGVLEIADRDGGRARVTVWNPDGSTAETSGNGLRIAAAWLAQASGETDVALATSTRQHRARVGPGDTVELALGAVAVAAEEHLDADGETVGVTPVSVGNPHAVVRLDRATRGDLLRLGPALERAPRFPERTNVQLVSLRSRHALDVLVWERGAGETPASGSSATAAAAVAVERGWCTSPVTVAMPGGELVVDIVGGEATLTGPVSRLDSGQSDL